MDPTAERVELPEGYGTATTTMEWGAVRGTAGAGATLLAGHHPP